MYVCVCVCRSVLFCWCESEIPSYSRFKTVRIDKLIAKTDNGASMRALTHGKRQKIVLLTIVLTCLMYEITAIIIHRWKEQHTVKERDRNEFSLAIGTYTLIHLCVCVCEVFVYASLCLSHTHTHTQPNRLFRCIEEETRQ